MTPNYKLSYYIFFKNATQLKKMQTFYTQQLAMPPASSSDILHVDTKTINWLNWIPQYYVFILKTHYFLLLFYLLLINTKRQEVYRHNTSPFLVEMALSYLCRWDNLWCDVIGRVVMKFWEFGKKDFFCLKTDIVNDNIFILMESKCKCWAVFLSVLFLLL